ncbi:MAG: alpha/beta hydrolase [Cellvibrio sp.]|uniref:alpha/beta hydrolase family protein n=1 Tax=Cellvibrio sp. TaxID=1965322 RepID=UPI0031AB465C
MDTYKTVFLAILFATSLPTSANADCAPGVYKDDKHHVAVITDTIDSPSTGFKYLLLDGRFGTTLSTSKPFECGNNFISLKDEKNITSQLVPTPLNRTKTTFTSAGTELTGELIEPAGGPKASRPLVVMVHGSEQSPAIGNSRALLLAGLGISVFVYDKRGTGQSDGIYTQNFELLADDAAAAMSHARSLAVGRFDRAGFWGSSQGGWVAPLSATRSPADFIVVGFGLVASPIEEDLDQMILEARQQKLSAEDINQIRYLSKVTAEVLRTQFTDGLKELEALRQTLKNKPWINTINGEYSGAMLRMSDAELTRIGRALFDNLELIWDYDSSSVMEKIKVPVLWIAAENDREAPSERTLQQLATLKKRNPKLQVYIFPNTDHGMYEYTEMSDGSRHITRVTDGYFRLVAEWIQEKKKPFSGNAFLLNQPK